MSLNCDFIVLESISLMSSMMSFLRRLVRTCFSTTGASEFFSSSASLVASPDSSFDSKVDHWSLDGQVRRKMVSCLLIWPSLGTLLAVSSELALTVGWSSNRLGTTPPASSGSPASLSETKEWTTWRQQPARQVPHSDQKCKQTLEVVQRVVGHAHSWVVEIGVEVAHFVGQR